MSIESELIQSLIALDTPSSDRVYDRQVPQGAPLPFTAVTKISGMQPVTLNGTALLARATMRIAIFGRSAVEEYAVARAIRTRFNGFRGFLGDYRVSSARVEDASGEVAFSDGDNVIKGTGLDLYLVYQEI